MSWSGLSRASGLGVVIMSAEEHDGLVALTSHLAAIDFDGSGGFDWDGAGSGSRGGSGGDGFDSAGA